MTSNAKAEGRFGKQDFRYVTEDDAYICPAGERLAYHYATEENGLVLRRYWTNACQVPSPVVLEFGDAISGISRVPGQAARSIG
jgi:hypothetical protein